MTLTIPQPDYKARFLVIGYGLLLLFWLSLEDRSTLTVSLLGTGATLIFGGYALLHSLQGRVLPMRLWFTGLIAIGALFGALSTLSTITLMFFKSTWHGHIYPDYPPQMIAALFSRFPIWTVSGALLGFCCAIFMTLQLSKSTETL